MEIALIFTLILSAVFIKIFITKAESLGLQAILNAWSVYKKMLPRRAGLGFVSTLFISQLIFNFSNFQEYYYIYLSIFAVMLTGFYSFNDDKLAFSYLSFLTFLNKGLSIENYVRRKKVN